MLERARRSDRDLARDLGPRRLSRGTAASDGLEAHRLVLHVNRAHEGAALRPVDEVSDVRRRLRGQLGRDGLVEEVVDGAVLLNALEAATSGACVACHASLGALNKRPEPVFVPSSRGGFFERAAKHRKPVTKLNFALDL